MADGMNFNSAVVDEALGNRMPGGAAGPGKPRLLVRAADPDVTVANLRNHLAATGELYDRGGVVVRLARDATTGGMVAHPMTADGIVRAAHRYCRPFSKRAGKDGAVEEVDARVSLDLARMYLDMRGEWHLPPLNGIASAPLLDDAGGVRTHDGYDAASGLWCEGLPDGLTAAVPAQPTRADAAAALLILRRLFRTFPFADAVMAREPGLDVPVVDLATPPRADESAAVAALLTAVVRPSLTLAPAMLVRAAPLSGAGSGKGKLVRVWCAVAFGHAPAAVTGGDTVKELNLRIGAELMQGGPALFLDNLNGMNLRSDTLASAITERPARVRVLGKSEMARLNSSAFIVATGNGLMVQEDLARRFLTVELDAKVEDPEARRFPGDVLAEAFADRAPLLAAALTVWRWGRHQDAAGTLAKGLALGSFDDWCRWVRDPLVALGCADPASRVHEAKQRDRKRETVMELFTAWHATHGSAPVTAAALADDILHIINPQGRDRQFVAGALGKLDKTRAGGFVLTVQRPSGKWGASTYAVLPVDQAPAVTPMPPMDAYDPETPAERGAPEAERWQGEL